MPAGRPPIPTALKILRGNPGKRPLNEDEPQLDVKIPERPEHLMGVARDEWDRLAPLLVKMGVLTEVDYQALANLCETYATLIDAQEKLRATGILIHNKRTGVFQQNPLMGIINRCLKDCLAIQMQFGLTPSARCRLHTGPKAKSTDNRWAKVGS
jgi:P27 family predicted phage terminase small subunit